MEGTGLGIWSPDLPGAFTSGVAMTNKEAQVEEREARMGRRVNGKVSVLLTEIEKEAVPDRLLELARRLQTALNEKNDG